MDAAAVTGMVTGIVGALTGAGGLALATVSWRRAGAATLVAEASRAGADSLEVSLQRIAHALDRDPHGRGASQPEFNVELGTGSTYRLRNVSTAQATNVAAHIEDVNRGYVGEMPTAVDLPPFASTDPFLILATMAGAPPGELLVTCDELANPARVPIPVRWQPPRR